MKRYEGMFLFDNAVAYEWPAVEREVRRLSERIGAQVHVCVKFDERKLAYEINGRKRGTYVLTYFDAPPDKIGDLERDARLSESILRVLVLRNDTITAEKLEELKAWPPDKPLQPLSSESRRDDRDGGRRDDRDGGRRDDRDGGRRDDRDGGRREGRRERHPRDESSPAGEEKPETGMIEEGTD